MKARSMALRALTMMMMMTFGAAMAAEKADPGQQTPPPSMADMPKPTAEHEWLQKFVGDWKVESEIHMEPGGEAEQGTGTESVRSLGGFWVVSDMTGEMMGMTMKAILTLGYDPEKQRYVGTWIDSMTSQMWHYDGEVDESGKVLMLTTRGMCPMEGKMADFKSTVEFKSDDERVFTEQRKMEDGSWMTTVVSHAMRKK